MAVLLDTNVLILVRDGEPAIAERYAGLSSTPYISIVSRIELEGGLDLDPTQTAYWLARLDVLLADLDILPFGSAEAAAYRRIVSVLGYSRRRVLDRMIAAQALCVGATLITANIRDFHDIPGLAIEDWSS